MIEKYREFMDSMKFMSDDPITQVIALIVDDQDFWAFGVNKFPPNVKKLPVRLERPEKLKWIEHAERDAIYQAAFMGIELRGKYMVLNWFPCSDCAKGIILSGLVKLYCFRPDFELEHWGEEFKVSHQMLNESHVEVIYDAAG